MSRVCKYSTQVIKEHKLSKKYCKYLCFHRTNRCDCMNCSERAGRTEIGEHIIDQNDMLILKNWNFLQAKDFEKFLLKESGESTAAVAKSLGLDVHVCTRCRFRFEYRRGVKTTVQCRAKKCSYDMCLRCEGDAHIGKTCEEAAGEEALKSAQEANVIMQACPFCKKMWGSPVECRHVICAKKIDGVDVGGCDGEFCFLCAAPHRQILAHDASYHRPGCSFRTACCFDDCVGNGAPHCKDAKYEPTHCPECKRLGKLCSVNDNPDNKYKILKVEQLDADK